MNVHEFWLPIALVTGAILSWNFLAGAILRSEAAKTVIFKVACKVIMRLEESTALVVVRAIILEQHGDMAKTAMKVSYAKSDDLWSYAGMLNAAQAAVEHEQKHREENQKSN